MHLFVKRSEVTHYVTRNNDHTQMDYKNQFKMIYTKTVHPRIGRVHKLTTHRPTVIEVIFQKFFY